MGALVPTARRKLTNAIARGEMSALPEWALTFAQWRVLQTRKRIPFKESFTQAQLFSPVPLNEREVRNVFDSKPYGKFLDWCMNDVGSAARWKFNQSMLKAVDLHADAMDWVRDEKDYRSVPALTEPIFDRLVPKKEQAAAQTNIQINLTTRQSEVLNLGEVVMESKAVEAEVEVE